MPDMSDMYHSSLMSDMYLMYHMPYMSDMPGYVGVCTLCPFCPGMGGHGGHGPYVRTWTLPAGCVRVWTVAPGLPRYGGPCTPMCPPWCPCPLYPVVSCRRPLCFDSCLRNLVGTPLPPEPRPDGTARVPRCPLPSYRGPGGPGAPAPSYPAAGPVVGPGGSGAHDGRHGGPGDLGGREGGPVTSGAVSGPPVPGSGQTAPPSMLRGGGVGG